MARILRNLKITEVASVDRGAGHGCRVVLYKRNGDTVAPDNGDDADDAPGNIGNDIDGEAYDAALRYLLHTPQGAALMQRFFPRGVSSSADVERLAGLVARVRRDETPDDPHMPWHDVIGEETETEKVHNMDREEFLKAAVRREGGIAGLCRLICKRGAQGISENELTTLITEHAMREYPDASEAIAFTRAYTAASAEPLRRAIAITKGALQADPAQVGVADVDDGDAAQAYAQLMKLAEAQRRRVPHLKMTEAQAFADQARQNPELARRAVGR